MELRQIFASCLPFQGKVPSRALILCAAAPKAFPFRGFERPEGVDLIRLDASRRSTFS